jgi:hypothetical protein
VSLSRLALILSCTIPASADAWIALRYDPQRILFLFAEHGYNDPDSQSEKIAPAQAQYAGSWEITRLTPEQFGSLKLTQMAISDLKPGRLDLRLHERLELRITAGVSAEVEIEDFIHQATCSDHFIGALARVTRGADAYAATPLKYYVVGNWKQPATAWRDHSIRASSLEAAEKTQVEASLAGLLRSELPKAESSTPEWKAIDSGLARGEGVLAYDVQSVPVGANGDLARYVRAQWNIGGMPAFLLAAWMDSSSHVIHVDAFTARALRMPDFANYKLDRANLPRLMNVFDLDGVPAVMMTAEGLESFTLELRQYTAAGLKPMGIEYGYGC